MLTLRLATRSVRLSAMAVLATTALACSGESPSDDVAASRSAVTTSTTTLCCYCTDDEIASLQAQLALATAKKALKEAEAARHDARAKESTADAAAAQKQLDDMPATVRTKAFKIAASGIGLGLELLSIRQFAKGTPVQQKTGLKICEFKLEGNQIVLEENDHMSTKYQKPSFKDGVTAIVKGGAGELLQVLAADKPDEKIPLYGAVVKISRDGADLIGTGSVSDALTAFISVSKGWAAYHTKQAQAARTAVAALDTQIANLNAKIAAAKAALDEGCGPAPLAAFSAGSIPDAAVADAVPDRAVADAAPDAAPDANVCPEEDFSSEQFTALDPEQDTDDGLAGSAP